MQNLAAALRIVTMQSFNQPSPVPGSRKYTCRFPAARAFFRYQSPAVMPSVEVFLNMRDYHVPLGNKHPASRMKLQIPDKRQVMQARPGYRTSINLYCVKYCHRRNLPGTSRLLFNAAEYRFVSVILKLESDTIFVMMPSPSKTSGIR